MVQHVERVETDGPGTQDASSIAPILGLFWRRKLLILLGVIVGLVLGGLYYVQAIPVYQSNAQVLVIAKRPETLPIAGFDPVFMQPEFVDYLSTHAAIIKSPIIANQAVEKGNLASLPSFAGTGNPASQVLGSLTVNRESKESSVKSNDVLYLSIQGSHPDDCQTVLDAVIAGYKDFLEQNYRNVSQDTIKLITQARDVLQKDLEAKETAYRQFRAESPLVWKGKETNTIQQDRLLGIEAERVSLLVNKAQIEARLAAIEAARAEGRGPKEVLTLANALMAAKAAETPRSERASALSLQEQLFPLQLEEQKLLQNYGDDHPEVKAVRKRIGDVKRLFPRTMGWGTSLDFSSDLTDADALASVESYVAAQKQELAQVQLSLHTLDELFTKEDTEARRLVNYVVQDEAFRTSITRAQEQYNIVLKRLQETNILKDYGGYDAQVIAPATRGVKIGPRALPTFGVAGFAGLLAGLGLAYLAHLADRSFHTPQEIRRRLGLPVVGHIRLLGAAGALRSSNGAEGSLPATLCTYHQPRSPNAEAFRGLRTALYFSTQGEAHKVIQITSPNMGDGKTTVAANLAVSIAQSGKSVLIIDADFRRPRLHKVFDVSATTGLASVLAQESEPDDAIQPTAIPGLMVLPCGPLPPNPAELLTSPGLEGVFDVLRRKYDYVLIDTPPLLAVTDPCIVAPRADGVLLVVHIVNDGRPDAERAKEIHDTLGASVLGVVVNGLGTRGASGYRDGYGYGYNYGSSYGDYVDETPQEVGSPEGAGGTANGAAGPRTDAASGTLEPHAHAQRETPSPGTLRRFFNW